MKKLIEYGFYIHVWCFARTILIYFPIKHFILKELILFTYCKIDSLILCKHFGKTSFMGPTNISVHTKPGWTELAVTDESEMNTIQFQLFQKDNNTGYGYGYGA